MSLSLTIKPGALGVDLRELHAALESKQEFGHWSKSRLDFFVKGDDFAVSDNLVKNSIGGRPRIDYAVSIDAAKQIAMMEQTEKGRSVRLWFIAREKQLSVIESQRALPSNYLEALEALVISEKDKMALVSENAELKPKADFHDAVTASDDLCQLATVCQVLDLPFGRNTLFQRLRNRGILISGGERHNLPKQEHVKCGRFTVKESSYFDDDKQPHVRFTTYVTQKGLEWIRREFNGGAGAVTA